MTTPHEVAGVLAEGPGVAPWRQEAARRWDVLQDTDSGRRGRSLLSHLLSYLGSDIPEPRWEEPPPRQTSRAESRPGPAGPSAGPAGVHRQGGREAPVTHDPPALEDSRLPGRPARCMTPLAAPDSVAGPGPQPTHVPSTLSRDGTRRFLCKCHAPPGWVTGFSCPSSDCGPKHKVLAIPPAPHAAGRGNCTVLMSRTEL